MRVHGYLKTAPSPVKFDRQGHSCNFYVGFGPTSRSVPCCLPAPSGHSTVAAPWRAGLVLGYATPYRTQHGWQPHGGGRAGPGVCTSIQDTARRQPLEGRTGPGVCKSIEDTARRQPLEGRAGPGVYKAMQGTARRQPLDHTLRCHSWLPRKGLTCTGHTFSAFWL